MSSSSNPVMREEYYQKAQPLDANMARGEVPTMTVNGAVQKTYLLTAILIIAAIVGYNIPNPILIWGGAIGGFVLVLVMAFRTHLAPRLAPVYAVLEGLFVGGISAMYASLYEGIIINAVLLTVAVLCLMLFLYQGGFIKVTEKLRAGVMMATGAVMVVYLISIVANLFGASLPYLHSSGPIGIGISLVIVGIAAFNLLLDFDNFEKGEQYGAPKYMEWFSAVGLLVTLIWLYLEILRLLAKLSDR
jgi:uncharacterized YccA/Bax inhibitor family protein